jgi:hypothetical protein
MSKSLGNFFTIEDILARFDAETTRFFIVRSHYRSALNYSDAHLDDARTALKRLYTALQLVPPADVAIDWSEPYAVRFKTAMDEDFGTPEAVAVLFDLASEVNRTRSAQLAGLLKALGGTLGLLQADPQQFLQTGATLDDAAIQARIAQRNAAKAERDFAQAAGAHEVMDTASNGWRDRLKALCDGKGPDVVFDPVCGPLFELAFRSINWGGRHLVVGFVGGAIPALPANLSLLKGAALVGVDVRQFLLLEAKKAAGELAELLQWVGEGRLSPPVGREFAFEDYRQALDYALSGQGVGKTLLRVSADR